MILVFICEFPVLCLMGHLVYHTVVSELSLKMNLTISGGQNSTSVYTCVCATEPMTPETGDIQGMLSKKTFGSIYSGKGQRVYKSHLRNICPKA